MSRDPQTVQREIEQARDAVARSLDQLVERANPRRLVEQGRRSLVARATSPAGLAVLGCTAGLVTYLVVRRVRHSSWTSRRA